MDDKSLFILLGGGLIFLAIAFMLAIFVVLIFYCLSLYKALILVPEEKLEFPAWFAWMILIPYVGLVFSWLTIFANIPKAFGRVVAGDLEAEAKLKSLSQLGLALVIMETICFVPYIGVLAAIPTIVVWIMYWVKIVEFRKKYLDYITSISM